MPRVIWNRPGNPSDYVSGRLGIARWQLRVAIHKIKNGADIQPDELVIIYDDGSVRDANGEPIGNIYDEI